MPKKGPGNSTFSYWIHVADVKKKKKNYYGLKKGVSDN